MNTPAKIALRRVLPVAVILLVVFLVYFLELDKYFNYTALQRGSIKLQLLVTSYPVLSPLLYMATYTIALCLFLPLSLYFTLLAGFLFPQPWCSLYALIAPTISCCLIFLVARRMAGELTHVKKSGLLARLQRGFERDATSYLLALRFSSLVPFWASNIGPALAHIPFWTYLWTTVVGLIPTRIVYTQAGRGLEAILASGEPLSLQTILNPDMRVALLLLALFALAPLLYRQVRRWRERRKLK